VSFAWSFPFVENVHFFKFTFSTFPGQDHLGTLAAVKVLERQLTDEEIERFRNEARTIARLEHPNIVRVLDFGIADQTPFLVMSYAPNGSLDKRHSRNIPLPVKNTRSYVKQIAAALQYAHEMKVIHRDVKPQNMLLGRSDEVLLGDFGLAVIAHTERSLSTQEMAGTVPYMAPEQIQGKPRPASDQYALGIVVYEWLCGVRPFQGTQWEIMHQHMYVLPPPLHEKIPAVPPTVEETVLKALAKDPQERFASVQDFAAAFEQANQPTEPVNIVSLSIQSPTSTSAGTSSSLLAPEVNSNAPAGDQISPLEQPTFVDGVPVKSELSAGSGPPAPASHDMLPGVVITPPVEVPPVPSVSASSPGSASMPGSSDSSSRPLTIPISLYPDMIPTEVSSDSPSHPSTTLPTSPHISQPIPPPSRGGLPRMRALLLLGMALLVIAGSVGLSAPIISKWIATLTTPTTPAPSDSTMFGFNSQHTHFNPGERTLSPTNVSQLVPYWMKAAGASIWSSPAIANGIVYVGSDDHKLYAFDASSGSIRWTAPTGGLVESSPAVANGVVYVGSGDQKFYAFDASTGKQLWTATLAHADKSSPFVANGVVYIGSGDHQLYAFNAEVCGNALCPPLWTAPTGAEIESAPVVVNGVVYVSSLDSKLYAFHLPSSRS
jgi:serine/threonine protein kinase